MSNLYICFPTEGSGTGKPLITCLDSTCERERDGKRRRTLCFQIEASSFFDGSNLTTKGVAPRYDGSIIRSTMYQCCDDPGRVRNQRSMPVALCRTLVMWDCQCEKERKVKRTARVVTMSRRGDWVLDYLPFRGKDHLKHACCRLEHRLSSPCSTAYWTVQDSKKNLARPQYLCFFA
ncbi:hypothetical protein BDY19DRAFT_313292 [Irpex rosettiformis]|uniref:Uncharacterized protein n=1 Tax=Irpex rosettiformis TaxID=378272 RepID=A0ACB8TY36_9APHY|nr:hypothetical protein BDY19DRAFT_313292 [Irpex rosettiformis]